MTPTKAVATAFVAAILSFAGAAPSLARDYPICSRGESFYTGGSDTPRCEFDTIDQCRASISGLGGYCTPNLTYAGPREPVRPRRAYRERY